MRRLFFCVFFKSYHEIISFVTALITLAKTNMTTDTPLETTAIPIRYNQAFPFV